MDPFRARPANVTLTVGKRSTSLYQVVGGPRLKGFDMGWFGPASKGACEAVAKALNDHVAKGGEL